MLCAGGEGRHRKRKILTPVFFSLFVLPATVVCFLHIRKEDSIVSSTILTLTDILLHRGGQSVATLKVQGLAALEGGEGGRVNRLRGIKAGEAGEGGGGGKMILGGGLVQRHGHDLLLLVGVTRHPLQRMVPQ